jgi:hypothetical protein
MRTILIALAVAGVCVAQAAGPPGAQEIVTRMAAMNEARAAAIHEYRSTRTYQVSYKGFPKDLAAKAVVQLQFKSPDQKAFKIVSEQGSSLLIDHVIKKALDSEVEAAKPEFRRRSALDEANYTFKYSGEDSVAGRPCYLLQVTPKREDKYLYAGKVCVDEADYAVARLDVKPAKNPSFWISRAHILSENQKVGDFWLPRSTRSTSHVRLGGNAELDIDYGKYEITDASPVQAPTELPVQQAN